MHEAGGGTVMHMRQWMNLLLRCRGEV